MTAGGTPVPGAYVTIHYNTEEQGWTGICVEPVPSVYAACRTVRQRVVQAACVAGEERQVELRTDRTGLWAGIATDEAMATQSYADRQSGEPDFETIVVPAMRDGTNARRL